MRKLMICFAAGCAGALINSLAVWVFGKYGIMDFFSVAMTPKLTPEWIYPRIVWGGLWGFLFLLPIWNAQPLAKGAFLSIFPTIGQLLVVFPIQAKKGYLGIELGLLTPIFVIILNLIWGWVAAFSIKYAR